MVSIYWLGLKPSYKKMKFKQYKDLRNNIDNIVISHVN